MILFNGEPIEFNQFPNGEVRIDKPFFVKHQVSDFSSSKQNTVTLKYEGDEDLFRLLLVRKSIWFGCALEIPYFPYSRMDRSSEEFIFTLKSVCKFINWMDWEQVIVFEPHSDVTPALLNHCKIVNMMPRLLKLAGFNYDTDYVLYPDSSAQKRYSQQIATDKELIAIKKRDFKTGRLNFVGMMGYNPGDLIDKTVWIVDDLCVKGGTFVAPLWKAKEAGAQTVNLVVAHCEGAIYNGKILPVVDNVYTTDSIIRSTVADGDHPQVHVFPYK